MIVEEPSENYVTGWIRLYRSIQNKGWYSDSEYVHLWVHLLISANHKGKEFLLNGEIVRLKSGQFVTGRKKLSEETGISESKIERILKCFESEQQIEQQTNSRNRILSIVSWDLYQNVEQQMNNKRTTSEQRVNTNNNDNNVKNENKYTHPLLVWIKDTLPNVSKLKTQITEAQAKELTEKYHKKLIQETLEAMENYKGVEKKYTSVYLTLLNWMKKRQEDYTLPDKWQTGRIELTNFQLTLLNEKELRWYKEQRERVKMEGGR